MSKPQKNGKPLPTDSSKKETTLNITFDGGHSFDEDSCKLLSIENDDLLDFDQERITVDVSRYNVNSFLNLSLDEQININPDELNERGLYTNRSSSQNIVYIQRSPRIRPSFNQPEIEVPRPPQAPSKPEINWLIDLLQPFGMIAVGVVMATMYAPQVMYFMVTMAIINLTISIVRNRSQLKKYKETGKTRQEKYGAALELVWNDLDRVSEEYQDHMLDNHVDLAECGRRVFSRDRRLWERSPTDEDFLKLRVGIGSVPFPAAIKLPPKEITLVDDPLLEKAHNSQERYRIVDNIPICLPLLDAGTAGIVGERNNVLHLARTLLMQMAVHHSYDEVKIVVVYGEHEEQKWSWINELPHCHDHNGHYFTAMGKSQAREILSNFYDMIRKREFVLSEAASSSGQVTLPFYVFLLTDREAVENEPIMRYLMKNNLHLGICSLFLFDQIDLLPSGCNVIINAYKNQSVMVDRLQNAQTQSFLSDSIPISQAIDIAKGLSPLRVQQLFPSENLPEQVSLLEVFGVRRVEDLNIQRRWENSKANKTLSALIGVKAGDEHVKLDIHDKYHGPHGLVAGTTGSGKSELLQTLILSISINYHPYDVMFVLIDYKGGGMANVFKGMPHLAGIITNLEGNQTTRALLSIKSELRRRQFYFDQVGVNHIDKYIQLTKEGRTEQAIPHLVIVVDEFAELKSEQPDFMSELVSTARVGRSLGVHLILATQKPAGIVDEQIWGNARFKICLKVQSTEDSQEVLKSTDASRITLPGRSYLQVGNNEIYELFQSAFSGAYYNHPSQEPATNGPITVELGDTASFTATHLESQTSGSSSTELDVLVKHMGQVAKRAGLDQLQGQWLPPLPEKLSLSSLPGNYSWNGTGWEHNTSWLTPPVGLVDNPSEQTQYSLTIDYVNQGHLAIYGAPGSGKTTFMQSLITSLALSYSPEDLNIYILDFGGRTLTSFSSLPHVGGVVTVDDEDKLKRMMKMVLREIDSRKLLFADNSVGSLKAYRESTGKKLQAIIIAVDNYPALSELYSESEEFFQQVSREGGNLGIYLTLSGGSVTSIQYKIAANIKQIVTFQLSDSGEYSTVVGRTNGIEPEAFDGRGLVKGNPPLEFQAALAVEGETEADRSATLNSLIREMGEAWQGKKAKRIPVIPEVLLQKDLLSDKQIIEKIKKDSLSIPMGLDLEELDPVYISLKEAPHFLVAGKVKTGKTTALKSIATAITSRHTTDEVELYIADSLSMGLSIMRKSPYVKSYSGNQPQLIDLMDKLFEKVEDQRKALSSARNASDGNDQPDDSIILLDFPRLVLMIDDFNDFMQMAEQDIKEKLEQLISRERSVKFHLLTAGMTNDISGNYEQFAKTIRDFQAGLLFDDAMEQQVFNLRISYSEANTTLKLGEGYLVKHGQYVKTKIAAV